jgi:hypothetical protein
VLRKAKGYLLKFKRDIQNCMIVKGISEVFPKENVCVTEVRNMKECLTEVRNMKVCMCKICYGTNNL